MVWKNADGDRRDEVGHAFKEDPLSLKGSVVGMLQQDATVDGRDLSSGFLENALACLCHTTPPMQSDKVLACLDNNTNLQSCHFQKVSATVTAITCGMFVAEERFHVFQCRNDEVATHLSFRELGKFGCSAAHGEAEICSICPTRSLKGFSISSPAVEPRKTEEMQSYLCIPEGQGLQSRSPVVLETKMSF